MKKLLLLLLASCSLWAQGGMLATIVGDTGHASGAFNPATLSGVQWDFATAFGSNCGGSCTNGANQTTWADKSSNANNLSVAGGPCAGIISPTYQTGITPNSSAATLFGFPTVGGDCMGLTNPVNLQTASTVCTVFALFSSSTGTQRAVVSGGMGSLEINMARTTLQAADKSNVAFLGTGTEATDTSWHLGCVTYDNVTVNFYLDGSSDGSNTPASAAITANETTFGAQGFLSHGFQGYIAESMAYNRILNGTELGQMHTYSVSTYGTP